MPELVEQMYCSQQIVIPPKFPYILKRYCKAAIKTQPYDLLRWSFEYFLALSQHRPPPVKLRLEYPIYSTEGGLTRGCLKVIANQLFGMTQLPLNVVKTAWQGFCLDPMELRRILCLCEVHQRSDTVPYLHFLATAGGTLTKTLTHTMTLMCEILTKEPDGGSAAVPVEDFLVIYRFLADMDASKDIKYINGYREGFAPVEEMEEEAEEEEVIPVSESTESELDEIWGDDSKPSGFQQKLVLLDAHVGMTDILSNRMGMPVYGLSNIERSPSVERAGRIEREAYMRERKDIPEGDSEVDMKLRAMSTVLLNSNQDVPTTATVVTIQAEQKTAPKIDTGAVQIYIYDEEENPLDYEIYGEAKTEVENEVSEIDQADNLGLFGEETDENFVEEPEQPSIQNLVASLYMNREERRVDLEKTFEDIQAIVNKYKTAHFDLGMVAGRQMSTSSGEFVVQTIEKEIMDYINDQIAILPDPDLKKKKAKPEEVAMIKEMLETFLDENMEVIVPEVEEIEEEEEPIPEIIVVYAVPGIGPVVDEDIVRDFEEYALDVSKIQADMFMPRNIRHFLCPPLEKYVEYKYDAYPSKREEVPKEGVITD